MPLIAASLDPRLQGDKATAQANLLGNPLEGRINQRFKFGLNTNHQDKSVPERKYYAAGFVPTSGTLEDLKQAIAAGYAWTPGTYEDSYRNKDNFIQAQLIGVDIDDGMTIAEALDHPFVKQYGLFIYTSALRSLLSPH